MANIRFTPNMQRQLDCPDMTVKGKTVAEVMAAVFKGKPQVRAYFLTDKGALKTHIAILVDGIPVKDRAKLSDPVGKDAELYIMQGVPDA